MISTVFIVISFVLFVLFLILYAHGSLEMFPTEEDQDKIKLVVGLLMGIWGLFCLLCIGARIAARKHPTKQSDPSKASCF